MARKHFRKRDASIDIEVNEPAENAVETAVEEETEEIQQTEVNNTETGEISYFMGDTLLEYDRQLSLKRCQLSACDPSVALEDTFAVSCSADGKTVIKNISKETMTVAVSAGSGEKISVPKINSKEINLQNDKYTADIFYSRSHASFLISVDDRRIAHTGDHDLSLPIYRCEAGTCSPDKALDILWKIGFDSSENKVLSVDCREESVVCIHLAPMGTAVMEKVKSIELSAENSDLYVRIVRSDVAESENDESAE